MFPWFLHSWPHWRVRHNLAPFWLPFAPSPADIREWNVEIAPPAIALANPLPPNGTLRVSLHRLLIEAGIALTLATSSWDPRSWFALYRYAADFAGTTPNLRFYSGVSEKDPRLTAVASEEIATGVTCYVLREHFQLTHIADAYACIQRGELTYVDPNSESRPDYFCQDGSLQAVIAESKGASGTRSKVSGRIDPEGWAQVENVAPVNLQLRASCGRVVIGTHLCTEGIHDRSESTTIIKDPSGDSGQQQNPESDEVLRLAYAKSLRFMAQDAISERLLFRRGFEGVFSGLESASLPRVAGTPILPLGITPFGDAIGIYGPTAKALFARGSSSLSAAVNDSLAQLSRQRLELDGAGYVLPNGVMVVHDPDQLIQ
jgi:hypothetical protein